MPAIIPSAGILKYELFKQIELNLTKGFLTDLIDTF